MSVWSGMSGWVGAVAGVGPSRLVTPFTPEDVVRAVRPEDVVEASRLSPLGGLMLVGASLLVGALMLGAAFWWWRAKNEGPGVAAFRVLADRMRLRPEERALVQVLARERRVAPAGLLVSLETLREMLSVPRSGGDEAARVWLMKRCVGVGSGRTAQVVGS